MPQCPWFLAPQAWESDRRDPCLVIVYPLATALALRHCCSQPDLLATPQSCQARSNLRVWCLLFPLAQSPQAGSLSAFGFLLKWSPYLNFHTEPSYPSHLTPSTPVPLTTFSSVHLSPYNMPYNLLICLTHCLSALPGM